MLGLNSSGFIPQFKLDRVLEAARMRGRKGGRKFQLTKAQVRLAQAAMGQKETNIGELCAELGVTAPTLYRYVAPDGTLREHGKRVLGKSTK